MPEYRATVFNADGKRQQAKVQAPTAAAALERLRRELPEGFRVDEHIEPIESEGAVAAIPQPEPQPKPQPEPPAPQPAPPQEPGPVMPPPGPEPRMRSARSPACWIANLAASMVLTGAGYLVYAIVSNLPQQPTSMGGLEWATYELAFDAAITEAVVIGLAGFTLAAVLFALGELAGRQARVERYLHAIATG